jgi:hypothetical protein
MLQNRAFQIALLFSMTVHGAVLLGSPDLGLFPSGAKEKVEIKFEKTTKKDIKPPPKFSGEKQEPLYNLPSKIATKRLSAPSFIDTRLIRESKEKLLKADGDLAVKKSLIEKPVFIQPDIISR